MLVINCQTKEKGIDAASVGLNPDGTVKDGDIEEFE